MLFSSRGDAPIWFEKVAPEDAARKLGLISLPNQCPRVRSATLMSTARSMAATGYIRVTVIVGEPVGIMTQSTTFVTSRRQ